MTHVHSAKLTAWLGQPLSRDVARQLEYLAKIDDITRIAVMPDVHLAEDVAVGTVVGARMGLYPDAVGSDVGCGILAARLETDADDPFEPKRLLRILSELQRRIPANRWPQRRQLPDTVLGRGSAPIRRIVEREGSVEFGTLGRGNHFVEIDADEADAPWIVIHCGSRAVGPAVRQQYRRLAVESGPLVGSRKLPGILADTDKGEEYRVDHDLAVHFAGVNREVILTAALEAMAEVFGALPRINRCIAAVHNFVRRELVGDEWLFVHRKGAISAREGEEGIIPGSMGTESFLVNGRGNAEAMYSSSHGAGRSMSRTEASRRISVREFERQMGSVLYDVVAAARLRDEAPNAYKSLAMVMRAQRDLTKVTQRLRPRLVYKGW